MDSDTGACFVQAACNGGAYATRTSRDECNLAVQTCFLMC